MLCAVPSTNKSSGRPFARQWRPSRLRIAARVQTHALSLCRRRFVGVSRVLTIAAHEMNAYIGGQPHRNETTPLTERDFDSRGPVEVFYLSPSPLRTPCLSLLICLWWQAKASQQYVSARRCSIHCACREPRPSTVLASAGRYTH